VLNSDRTEQTRKRWESIYQGSPPGELPWEEGRPSPELVELIESGVVEKGAALDICCGSGNNAVYLVQQGFSCYGIDISPSAIGYAQEKASKAGVKCELVPGNVLHLPYPDGFFTLVFDRGCFHSIASSDRENYIRGVHRVLQTGGKYQLQCFSSRGGRHTGVPYSFTRQEIRRYFSPLFKIHHIRELVRDLYGVKHYFLSALMEKVD
jgi:ubiquinone/menaquinone biosynthesis C-methylase UbiE